MQILVVPDVHGRDYWKRAEIYIDSVDKAVFIGDYFDSFTVGYDLQMANFKNILDFKKKYPDKVCLCWGNHESSYYLDERCSGYQSSYARFIKYVLNECKDLLEIVYIFGKWVFSHAGVSSVWMQRCGLENIEGINDLFKSNPNYFKWAGPCTYGDNVVEGPLWIRPGSLQKYACAGYNYIVGHTELKYNPHCIISDTGRGIVCCDNGGSKSMVLVDTDKNKWKELVI